MSQSQILDLLGDEAEYYLGHQSQTIPQSQLQARDTVRAGPPSPVRDPSASPGPRSVMCASQTQTEQCHQWGS